MTWSRVSMGSFFLVAASVGADAASLTVTGSDDVVANDGVCSVREAITAANTGLASGTAVGECGQAVLPPYTRIDLPAGTYRLSRTGTAEDANVAGDLDIRVAGLEIVGAGADLTTLRGDRTERVLDIGASAGTPPPGSAPVVLAGLTLRDGSDLSGGGIRGAAGWALQVDHCTVANNEAAFGGGIATQGALGVTASTFHANVTTDALGVGGGAIHYAGTAVAQLRNTTFNANESLTGGSALLLAGPARLNNVTAAQNVADADFNDSGDAAVVALASVELANSIVAANIDFSLVIGGTVNPDCVASLGTLSSLDHNLIGNIGTACALNAQPGDQIGNPVQALNPRLLPLGFYGGHTETQIPAANSPAVDQGAPTGAAVACEGADQRDVARPQGLRCDAGAVESDDLLFRNGFEPA